MSNPFNPTFGDVPKIFLDEDSRVDDLLTTIKESNFARSFFITGVRGSGKTVFLNAVGHKLDHDENCYHVILLNQGNLVANLTKKLINLTSSSIQKVMDQVDSVSLHGVNIDLNKDSVPNDDILRHLLSKIKQRHKYVVVSIDEITNSEAVRRFAQVFNELKGEDLPIFVLMTGLPDLILNIQTEKKLTFLLRSEKIHTLPLKNADIINSYHEIFNCSLEVANKMAKMTAGYAYAFQLLGFLLYEKVSDRIPTMTDLQKVETSYQLQLFDNAYQKIFVDLSDNDREYLLKVQNEGSFDKILTSWQKNKVYVAQYRRRAIERDLIKPVGHGLVRFTLPYFDEYLKQVQNPDSAYYFGY